MKNNSLVNCTHPVPPNNFGITVMHCADNVPMSGQDLLAIINGPVAAIECDLQRVNREVVIVRGGELVG